MGQPDEPSRQTRRALLVACGTVAVAGCLDRLDEADAPERLRSDDGTTAGEHSHDGDDTPTETPTPQETHPFAGRTATVTIERVEADRSRLERLLREAITFWNENHEAYLGYLMTFEYRPEAMDPDVVVEERAEIEECGLHDGGEFAGCATLLQAGDHDALPAEVELVPAQEDWLYRTTIKHELGHVLGLRHDDEPTEIMHESLEYRYPEFDERMEILERRNEWVREFNVAVEALTDGFDAADGDDFETAASVFATANEHYETAANLMEEAAEIAADLSPFEPADREALFDMLEHEREFVASIQSAVDTLQEGSERIADGEDGYDTYNEGIKAYNDTIEIQLPASSEYVDVLGLSSVVTDGEDSG